MFLFVATHQIIVALDAALHIKWFRIHSISIEIKTNKFQTREIKMLLFSLSITNKIYLQR